MSPYMSAFKPPTGSPHSFSLAASFLAVKENYTNKDVPLKLVALSIKINCMKRIIQ